MKSGAVPSNAIRVAPTATMSAASGLPYPVFRGSLVGSESQKATGSVYMRLAGNGPEYNNFNDNIMKFKK